tara:strand:- start:401 stop:568 length:168 start_codon:yes stop_codon:yes gene_type:complete
MSKCLCGKDAIALVETDIGFDKTHKWHFCETHFEKFGRKMQHVKNQKLIKVRSRK